MWLIWSIEHDGWWKANWGGYTRILSEAGLYNLSDAMRIVEDANKDMGDNLPPNEAMIYVKGSVL